MGGCDAPLLSSVLPGSLALPGTIQPFRPLTAIPPTVSSALPHVIFTKAYTISGSQTLMLFAVPPPHGGWGEEVILQTSLRPNQL